MIRSSSRPLCVVLLACLATAWAPALLADTGAMAGPPESLVSWDGVEGWSVGVRYGLADREITFGDTSRDFDFERVYGFAGCDLLPFLHARVAAGWVKAGQEQLEAEGGFEWTAGATLSCLAHVISQSPPAGKKQVVSLAVDVTYGEGESNFEESFEWSGLAVSPVLRYTADWYASDSWRLRGPSGIAVFCGVQYADMEADLGGLAGNADRDFALRAGADMRLGSGWLLQCDGVFYSDTDRRIDVGLGYYFR